MNFTNKEVEVACSFNGDLENVPLCLFTTKEEEYAMMLMSTYGENERLGDYKFRVIGGERIIFNYPRLWKDTTRIEMLRNNTIQGTKKILHLRRHGPQGAGKTVF